MFGPEKAATPERVTELDGALSVFARAVATATGREVADRRGAGAAGGLGAAFLAFFNARLRAGVDVVMEATGLEQRMVGADLVLTGEGTMDAQTLHGKTPFGVAQAARRHGIPVIAFVSHIGEGAQLLYDNGFAAIVPIVRSITDLPDALAQGPANLERAVETVCRVLMLGDRARRS